MAEARNETANNHQHQRDGTNNIPTVAQRRIMERLQETATNIHQFRPADRTYVAAWRKFREFVDRQRQVGVLDPGDRYVERKNIDL